MFKVNWTDTLVLDELLLELDDELLELELELLDLDELDELLLELDDELLELEDEELLLLDACVCAMTVDNDCARGLNCIDCVRLMGSSKIAPIFRTGLGYFASFRNELLPVSLASDCFLRFVIKPACSKYQWKLFHLSQGNITIVFLLASPIFPLFFPL